MPLVPWPTDPDWRRFAALVADAVMLAEARGIRISADHGWCPLGAAMFLRGCSRWPRPFADHAAELLDIQRDCADTFAQAFDNLLHDEQPATRLGRAYRERALRRAR